MSTLTKILVVVFVVLAIFASTVFIRQAVERENWRSYYQQQVTQNQILQANLSAAENRVNAAQTALADLRRQGSSDMTALRQQLEGALDRERAAQQELRRLEGEIAGLTLALNQATGVQDQLTQLNQQQQTQLVEGNRRIAQLAEQLSRLEQTAAEQRSAVEQLTRQTRYLQETLAEEQQRSQQLEQQLAGGAAPAAGGQQPVSPTTSATIQGQIAAVRDGLAQINVGSASGVRQGMQFIIYRNDQYVADLQVESVMPDSASGVLVNQRQAPQQGDVAVNAGSLR